MKWNSNGRHPQTVESGASKRPLIELNLLLKLKLNHTSSSKLRQPSMDREEPLMEKETSNRR